jgi:hypothetical protein
LYFFRIFCANNKIDKCRDEKRSVKKRQNLEIQPAVAKNKKTLDGLCLDNINNREKNEMFDGLCLDNINNRRE